MTRSARRPAARLRRVARALMVSALAGVSACSAATRAGAVPVETDERAVWTVLIDSMTGTRGRMVAIDDGTLTPSQLAYLPDERYLRRMDVQLPFQPIADLMQRSVVAVSLQAMLGERSGVWWIAAADRHELMQQGWERLQTRHPGTGRVVRLSRVGFDRERRYAAVGVSWWCGVLCGGFEVVMLRRDRNRRWSVVQHLPTVVS